MESIILVGGGGHCKSIIDTIQSSNEFNIYGIVDLKENVGKKINNISIIDSDDNLYKYKGSIKNAFVCIGSVGDVSIRKRIYYTLIELGYNLPKIIDKTAVLAENVRIGDGTFIGKRAIVNSDSVIGENCIINSGAIIEHDCIVEDFVHVAPGAVICGGVHIGENSHIGANSTILQYKKVGENTIIGAGSVVTKNIAREKKAYGNPCREV